MAWAARQPITSPRHPAVVAARRLHKRSARYEEERFLAEGAQAVSALLALAVGGEPAALLGLFCTDVAYARHPDLVDSALATGSQVWRIDDRIAGLLSDTVTPQGLLALAATREVGIDVIATSAPRLVVVLVEVRDPGNAGTVLRVADATGADAVVFTEASVDPYNGKCVRAAAGSLFHLPFAVDLPVATALAAFDAAGVQVLAAAADGELDLDDAAEDGLLAQPTAWLFGNEAHGLPVAVRARARATVRVPIHGRAESLNLATASAVCLYATARAQRGPRAASRA